MRYRGHNTVGQLLQTERLFAHLRNAGLCKTKLWLLTFGLIVSSPIANAQERAHTHGVAELAIAVEGPHMEIELISPAANIVGFEHRVKSDSQMQALKQATSTLSDAQQLFSIDGANCTVESASVDVSSLLAPEDSHGHEHKNEHAHASDNHNNQHAEVVARYHYSCDKENKLRSISTSLFNKFSALEKIKVIWITDTNQGSLLINPGNSVVSLE